MEHLSNCLVCGDDREDGYHVVMECPHAVNLHAAMRLRWCLPAERELKFTGPEWLHGIVDTQPVEQVACLLLIFWRAWFIRNELTHSNKKLSLKGSVSFLENYWETLCGTRQQGPPDDKGKNLVGSVPRPAVEMGSMVPVRWSGPR